MPPTTMPPQHGPQAGGGLKCVCGGTFSRSDSLERHIASKNKVAKVYCSLCEHDETAKSFSRLDHLAQHLRTFHKIPKGRIPEDLAVQFAHDGSAEESMPAPPIYSSQSMPAFPCPIPDCMRIGEFAYFRQIDLDEHMLWVHYWPQNNASGQQGLFNFAPAGVNGGLQQSIDLYHAQIFGQDVQENGFLQSGPVGSFQSDGVFPGDDILTGRSLDIIQPDEELDMGFRMNINLGG
ncbi:hypothetical protein F5Y10DRAFT_210519 [Nemania abortiva]|nr:hypothetical protein F5Y10DRAFT_210519 [Nemania abortiva]